MDAQARAFVEAAAIAAARQAQRDTFRLFGLDLDDQEQLNAFRADLIYARRLRKLSDGAWGTVLRAALGALTLALLALLGDGLRRLMGDH